MTPYNNPFNSINTNIGRYIYNIYIICSTSYCGLSYFVISGHPQIWILGDSIVRRAKERAAATRRLQLGTPYTIQWHGQGGARLEDVERMVDNRLMFSAPPSLVVLHLGTNNIGQMDACSCRAAIKTALGTLRVRMPKLLSCGPQSSPASSTMGSDQQVPLPRKHWKVCAYHSTITRDNKRTAWVTPQ